MVWSATGKDIGAQFSDMLMSYNEHQSAKLGPKLEAQIQKHGSSSEGNGYGELQVYAGGCALSDGYNAFYYIDKDKGIITGNDIIQKMFEELFDYVAEDKKGRNGYTLYAHNLGRFDSVFVLQSLTSAGAT